MKYNDLYSIRYSIRSAKVRYAAARFIKTIHRGARGRIRGEKKRLFIDVKSIMALDTVLFAAKWYPRLFDVQTSSRDRNEILRDRFVFQFMDRVYESKHDHNGAHIRLYRLYGHDSTIARSFPFFLNRGKSV